MLIKSITTLDGAIKRITNFGKFKNKHVVVDTWKEGKRTIETRMVVWDSEVQQIYHKTRDGWTI